MCVTQHHHKWAAARRIKKEDFNITTVHMLESQIHIERMIEKEIKMGKTKATTVTLHEVFPKAPFDILLGVPFLPPEAQQPRTQAHVGSVQTRDQTTN